MKEHPILFSAPMVRALLAGTKTQTRRVVKPTPPDGAVSFGTYYHPDPRPHFWAFDGDALMDFAVPCPYGQPGDKLWVRETLKPWAQDPELFAYAADDTRVHSDGYNFPAKPGRPYVPSIHLARCWSRITLEITDVRVERLQCISDADALAEGISLHPDHHHRPRTSNYGPYQTYCDLWESINGPGSWDANPWVWVIEFRRIAA